MVIQQGRRSCGAGEALAAVKGHGGLFRGGLFRGVAPAMIREGVYTACYLGAAPTLRAALMAPGGALEGNGAAATAAAAAAVGCGAGAATQPFDTVKTVMQHAAGPTTDLKTADQVAATEKAARRGTLATLRHVVAERGVVEGLYAGFLPRTARLVIAVGVLGATKDALESAWLELKAKGA